MNLKKNCLKIWKKMELVIIVVDFIEIDVLDYV